MNNKLKVLYTILGCIVAYFLFMNFAYVRKVTNNGNKLVIINKITNTAYSKKIEVKRDKENLDKKIEYIKPENCVPGHLYDEELGIIDNTKE